MLFIVSKISFSTHRDSDGPLCAFGAHTQHTSQHIRTGCCCFCACQLQNTLRQHTQHTKVNNKSSIILLLQPNRSPGKLSVCTVHTLGRFTTKRISKTKYIFYCIMDITLFILLQFFGSVLFYFIFLFLLFLSKAYGKEHLNFSVVYMVYGILLCSRFIPSDLMSFAINYNEHYGASVLFAVVNSLWKTHQ